MPSGAEKISEQAEVDINRDQAEVDINRAGHLHGWAAWSKLSGAQCG